MAQWRETNIDAGMLTALAIGFGSAVLVGLGAAGWIDGRIDARVDARLEKLETRIERLEDRVRRRVLQSDNTHQAGFDM